VVHSALRGCDEPLSNYQGNKTNAMAQYKIIDQAIEIGGKTYQPESIVDESIFAPAPVLNEIQIAEGVVALTEIESLLSTGHIELI